MMDNGNDRCPPTMSHSQAKVLSRKMADAREQRFLETSRKRLDTIVSTKMRTAFIGALAAFEEEFGFLWGRGLAEHQLTEEQRSMQELWDSARTAVLNNGNTQLRAVRTEIANHVIKWNRHHIQFVVKTEETDNE